MIKDVIDYMMSKNHTGVSFIEYNFILSMSNYMEAMLPVQVPGFDLTIDNFKYERYDITFVGHATDVRSDTTKWISYSMDIPNGNLYDIPWDRIVTSYVYAIKEAFNY